jgi:hypothetical protein
MHRWEDNIEMDLKELSFSHPVFDLPASPVHVGFHWYIFLPSYRFVSIYIYIYI